MKRELYGVVIGSGCMEIGSAWVAGIYQSRVGFGRSWWEAGRQDARRKCEKAGARRRSVGWVVVGAAVDVTVDPTGDQWCGEDWVAVEMGSREMKMRKEKM